MTWKTDDPWNEVPPHIPWTTEISRISQSEVVRTRVWHVLMYHPTFSDSLSGGFVIGKVVREDSLKGEFVSGSIAPLGFNYTIYDTDAYNVKSRGFVWTSIPSDFSRARS